MTLWITLILLSLPRLRGQPHNDHDRSTMTLPYRPMATNRIGTMNFITKVLTIKKTYNLHAHQHYFNQLISLWSTIFMENELRNLEEFHLHPKEIDNFNPECRDLRSIIMEELKSVGDILTSNTRPGEPLTRFKRSVRRQPLMPPSIKKRSFLAKSALSMLGTYMTKKGYSTLKKNIGAVIPHGLVPMGGDILSYVFGIAQSREVEFNRRKLQFLSNQFHDFSMTQRKLLHIANLTKLMIDEMTVVIRENDRRIIELFNITEENQKITRRSIVCLQLYSESSYIIDSVKSNINDFIMADTMVPEGNKKLFTEAELRFTARTHPGHKLATGNRNLWDYSLFNMQKSPNEWTYSVQIPLTNLPMFTIYKVSPFPVFPRSSNTTALIVNIPPNTDVILSEDDKYFIDKIDRELCTFSGTHGACSGPIGLIDVDFGGCPVSLMLHSPAQMITKCKFAPYNGLFPRIASSMGQSIISSKNSHDFIKTCSKRPPDHLTISPGSSSLELPPGCSLNTSDIILVNPKDNTSITDQQIDLPPVSMFRFRDPLVLQDSNLLKSLPNSSNLNERVQNLELTHVDDTPLNSHIERNSIMYITMLVISISVLLAGTVVLYLKISLMIPILSSMRKFLLPETRRMLKRHKRNHQAAV